MRKGFAVLALGCLLSLAPVTVAEAAGPSPPVADCEAHGGQLVGHWSTPQLQNALATMPADIREYSDCYDVIQQALLKQIHHLGGGSSSGDGGSFLPVWLIVVLAVVVLGGAGLGVAASRNRGQET